MIGRPRATWRAASAVRILSFPPTACYSEAHFSSVGGALEKLDLYKTIFVDSITAISRFHFGTRSNSPRRSRHAGIKDIRGAYGLHAREMLDVAASTSARA